MRRGSETSFVGLTRRDKFSGSFYQFRREDVKHAGYYEQAIYAAIKRDNEVNSTSKRGKFK
jgi:hypothetical protein